MKLWFRKSYLTTNPSLILLAFLGKGQGGSSWLFTLPITSPPPYPEKALIVMTRPEAHHNHRLSPLPTEKISRLPLNMCDTRIGLIFPERSRGDDPGIPHSHVWGSSPCPIKTDTSSEPTQNYQWVTVNGTWDRLQREYLKTADCFQTHRSWATYEFATNVQLLNYYSYINNVEILICFFHNVEFNIESLKFTIISYLKDN